MAKTRFARRARSDAHRCVTCNALEFERAENTSTILPLASTSFRRQAAAKFIIEARIAEIALLVGDPFLQSAVRLDRELRHDASPRCCEGLRGIPGLGSACGRSRSLAQTFAHCARTEPFENCHGTRHGKLPHPRVEGLGTSWHHVAVLHAWKDMQLHIALS